MLGLLDFFVYRVMNGSDGDEMRMITSSLQPRQSTVRTLRHTVLTTTSTTLVVSFLHFTVVARSRGHNISRVIVDMDGVRIIEANCAAISEP